MLSKLLKRCMPWMVRGRWYHVSIDTTGKTPTAVFDPVFESVTIEEFNITLKIPNDQPYQMIDGKASIRTLRPTIPNLTNFMEVTNLHIAPSQSDPSAINVTLFQNTVTDYWFFMVPIDYVLVFHGTD